MKAYPWKSRAVCLFAPPTAELEHFCDFVRTVLPKDRIDTLFLLIRYRYQFESHPECRGDDPFSREDARRLAEACRSAGVRLVPKMNLFGHQNVQDHPQYDGLLRAYPEFDETPEIRPGHRKYALSLCPSNPKILPILLDLADEMVEAFSSGALHIGCDEVLYLGECEKCRQRSHSELFGGWVAPIINHLKARGTQVYMWGDRLLDSAECPYGSWEASSNGTAEAIRVIDRDTVICDWHYEDWKTFPSVDVFAREGFSMYLCPFKNAANATRFFDYAAEHERGNVLGILHTTWIPWEFFINCYEGTPYPHDGSWHDKVTPYVVAMFRWLFEDGPEPEPENEAPMA